MAKGYVIKCLNPEIKQKIYNVLQEERIKPQELTMLEKIKEIPECSSGMLLEIGAISTSEASKDKKKRVLSKYNLFIAKCMKSKNIKGFGNAAPAMKECALEWRAIKNKGGV